MVSGVHTYGGEFDGEGLAQVVNQFPAVWVMFAGITDIIGGRSGMYESRITKSRKEALDEMQKNAQALGANAVVGVEVNYTTITSDAKSMFMIVASGTAVVAR